MRVTVIEHVTAIPLDSDRRITDATIVIEGDRIARVAPSAAAAATRADVRIDGRGLFAVPGFADMHVHPYDTEGFASYLAYGITTIGVMHGSPTVLDWRSRQRGGALDGPTIYTASPTVNGYPPGNPLFIAVQDTLAARLVADHQKQAGYDFIKVYSFLNPAVYDALLDEAHRVGIPVVGHIPFQMDYRWILRAGQTNVAHIEEFFQSGDIPDDSMPVLARRVKDGGATVTVNLFAYVDYLRTIADIQAVLHDQEMRYASPAQLSEKLPTSNRATNRPNLGEFAAFLRTRLERFKRLMRELQKAGVPLLIGTDTETFGFPGQSAQIEMLTMGESGLTAYEVLRAAAANAGEFVASSGRGSERFGQLLPGMRADVVLLRGDPLVDIRNIREVGGVIARGRYYSPARLSAMRDSVAKRTTPQREFVVRFDSLIMKAKEPATAAQDLASFVAANPGSPPFAELVWSGYGRLTIAKDPQASLAIRELETQAYPYSASAVTDVARALLIRHDTLAALARFRRAHELSPDDQNIADLIDKLTAANTNQRRAESATITFDSIEAKVRGQSTRLRIRVVVDPAPEAPRPIVYVNSDSATATEAVMTPNRGWVFAPFAGQSLELRWSTIGSRVEGTWVLGWANNGRLTGRKESK
jgi:imidazolonepropionase-like amidohydrolase